MLVFCRNLCFKLGCRVFEHEGYLKSLQPYLTRPIEDNIAEWISTMEHRFMGYDQTRAQVMDKVQDLITYQGTSVVWFYLNTMWLRYVVRLDSDVN